MTITKIVLQQKNEKRYSVFIDGKFAFGISDVDLLFYKLKEFDEISEEYYAKILDEVIFVKAREMAYRFLSYKLRTEKEVRTKLLENLFIDDIVERVIELLKGYGYVDDEKYASLYVSEKSELNGFGKKRILYELKERGIATEIAQNAVSQHSFDELGDCLFHLEKKLRGKKELNGNEREKCINYLLRRGFEFSLINSALKLYLEGEHE